MTNEYKFSSVEPFEYPLHLLKGDNDFISKTLETVGLDDSSIKAVIDKGDSCEAVVFELVLLDIANYFFVGFSEYLDPKIVVHESKHILNMIYNMVNYQPQTTNDELECYTIERLFKEINNFVDED